MFGTLECTVFYEGKDGDVLASEPLLVRATLFSKLKGYLFWGILLPLLLLKENRNMRALWAFLPYAAWIGVAAGIDAWVGLPGGMLVPVPMIFCGLLLAGARFRNWNGWVSVLGAALMGAAIHGAWILAGKAEAMPFSAIGSGCVFLAAAVALAAARLACRGRYGAGRLSLALLPAALLATAAVVAGIVFTMAAVEGEQVQTGMILELLVPAAIAGLIVYGMLMSFMAIAFLSAFHRERLCWLLKLERNVPPASEPPPMPGAPI